MARPVALIGTRPRAPLMVLALLGLACHSSPALERVPIPPGATIRTAADSLKAHGIISSTAWFRLRARWAHAEHHLRSGIYQIRRGAGTRVALAQLLTGRTVHFRVTVPAGGTIFDLAHSASQQLGIPADSTLAAAHDTTLLHRLSISATSAEGWLLPQSFDFGGFDTPREVVTRFAAARARDWDSSWTRRARTAGLDQQSLLALASLVEAETADTGDRRLIAAVYLNRLHRHMPLQADPTIEYAYLLTTGARKGRLYNKDYSLNSPWNTYLRPGLPPGPIDNPSRASIEAVLSPAKVGYLYFVAGPAGKAIFATTYSQHLRNVQRVQRAP
jgi:UPF0755 protein